MFSRQFRVKKPCFVVVVKKDLLVKPGNKNFRLLTPVTNRAYIGRKKTIKNHIENNNLNKTNSQIDVLVNKL